MQSKGRPSLGDRVFHSEHGYGSVTALHSWDGCLVRFGDFEVFFSLDDYWQLVDPEISDSLAEEFKLLLASRYLDADALVADDPRFRGLDRKLHELKLDFLREWFENDSLKHQRITPTLDDEQILAVGSVRKNYQVIARAGSGKTTVSVYRTYFLVEHCRISPSQIMLLTFNRDASIEIRRRLLFLFSAEAGKRFQSEKASVLKSHGERSKKLIADIEDQVISQLAEELGVEIPFAMTFHALARAIVRPTGSILYDDTDARDFALSSLVQEQVDEALKDELRGKSIRQLMMKHFKQDWETISGSQYQMTREELLAFRRSMPHLSIDGHARKSHGEKVISDFLFEHSVEYFYERNQWWGRLNYKPDFTILKPDSGGIVIEYFGLDDPAYREQIEAKRKYWGMRPDWTFLEFTKQDIAADSGLVLKKILAALDKSEIPVQKLTEDEIWEIIKPEAILRYTKAMTGFIMRCRQLGWDTNELSRRIAEHSSSGDIETLFLRQALFIFRNFETMLKMSGNTDFAKLMSDAAEMIRSGRTTFHRRTEDGDVKHLKYLIVDEFQDFSFNFNELLQSVMLQNEAVRIFCVGDDWQAINGFAGSDLQYFHGFKEIFEETEVLNISTNYRSDGNIVNLANRIMSGNGVPAKASKPGNTEPEIGLLEEFVPTATELSIHEHDVITPALLRLINSQILLNRNVVILSRTNTVPFFIGGKVGNRLEGLLQHLREYFPDEMAKRITINTAHRYKGREQQAVIVLDANKDRYPLIHPDWIFTRILGTEISTMMSEERRLFYVALTRAVDHLIVLVEDRKSVSPFLTLETHGRSALNWSLLSAPTTKDSPVVVQVSNAGYSKNSDQGTIAIREFLKVNRYLWHSHGRYWHKAFLSERFDIELVKSESWSANGNVADNVKVSVVYEPYGEIACYLIVNGEWRVQFEDLKVIKPPSDT